MLPTTGASATTVYVACAACEFVPCEDPMLPAGIVLTYVFGVFEITSTLIVHLLASALAGAMFPPVSATDFPPAVVFTLPPQPFDTFGGVAMTRPAGSESVTDRLPTATG